MDSLGCPVRSMCEDLSLDAWASIVLVPVNFLAPMAYRDLGAI